MTKEELQSALEDMVDESSLREVIEALAETAGLKALHVRENWQDSTQAKLWEHDAAVLDRAAVKLEM